MAKGHKIHRQHLRAKARAYYGGKIIEPGELITPPIPDGVKLPSWVEEPDEGADAEQVAVPAPVTSAAKGKTEPGTTAIPAPVPSGADWVKPGA